MWDFTPDKPAAARVDIPYIEDANKNTAPNYSSTKTVEQAKVDVAERLEMLGGSILSFQGGIYTVDGKQRHGFIIRFTLDVEPFNGAEGVYRVMGLPSRTKTPTSDILRRIKVQALLTVADWFKSAYMARLFSPDAHPLVPYLILPGKDGRSYTVTEAVTNIIKRDLPHLVSENEPT